MHRDRVISRQRLIQMLAAALFNGYAAGFQKGRIFTGGSKDWQAGNINCIAFRIGVHF